MRNNIARNTWLLFFGFSLLILGSYLGELGIATFFTESIQTAGIAVLSLLIGFWIYNLFGGSPELNEIKLAISEFERGAHLDRLGVKSIYRRRSDAKADMLKDISSSKYSTRMFASVYIGEILKDPSLPGALLEAMKRSHADDNIYVFEYYSFDPNGQVTSPDVLEAWAKKEGDNSDEALKARITRGSNVFENLIKNLIGLEVAGIQGVRKYYDHYLSPHSMLVIDDETVYVSYYDWGNKQGDHAATLKLRDGPWAVDFLKEAKVVAEKYSKIASEY